MVTRSKASDFLTQQTVSDILEDSTGFIWIITAEGANRYDGHEVVAFTHDRKNPESLSHQHTSGIAQTATGDIWISTLGGGLNRLNSTTLGFDRLRKASATYSGQLISDNISAIEAGGSGGLWIGYADASSFSKLNDESLTVRHYDLPAVASGKPIIDFVEGRDGSVYIAIDGAGVYTLAPNS
ncbi:MAG: hypothetical protein V2I82_04070, partial [Halieaceae bacterium]|nr:hypothetical protein [Halieaceae bacterium]